MKVWIKVRKKNQVKEPQKSVAIKPLSMTSGLLNSHIIQKRNAAHPRLWESHYKSTGVK